MGPRVGQVNGPTNTNTQVKVDVITAQKDDTLEKIAERERIPLTDLKDANPKMDPKKALNQGQDVNYPKDLLVQHGETTLDQVADRMGIRSKQALIEANKHIKNPNNLREGEHINLPKDFKNYEPKSTPNKEKRITKDGVNLPGGAGQITGGKGGVVYRPPTLKIGGVTVPLPDVVLTDGKGVGVNKTDGTYDGTGDANTARRRQEEKNISNTRQKDERDVDPRNDKNKPVVKKPFQQMDEELKKRMAEEADELIRKGRR